MRFLIHYEVYDRPDGRALACSSLERELRGSILGPVTSYIMLPTARHRCDIRLKAVVLPGRNDAENGPPTRYTLRRNAATLLKDFICKLFVLCRI